MRALTDLSVILGSFLMVGTSIPLPAEAAGCNELFHGFVMPCKGEDVPQPVKKKDDPPGDSPQRGSEEIIRRPPALPHSIPMMAMSSGEVDVIVFTYSATPDLGSDLEKRDMASFRIATRPVTTAEFRTYCRQAILQPCQFRSKLPDKAPALGMRFVDARGYAEWLSGASGRRFALPSHVQLARAFSEKLGASVYEFFDAEFDDQAGRRRRVALSPYYERDVSRGFIALTEDERNEQVGFRLVEVGEERP